MAEEIPGVLAAGLALAVAFNPLASIVVAPVAAALLGGRTAPDHSRIGLALAIVACGWLVGDGLRVLGRTRDVYDSAGGVLDASSPLWAQYGTLGLWAVGGVLLGYALPVWAGAFVGRRVTRGTGWLAAAMVAGVVSAMVAMLAAGPAV